MAKHITLVTGGQRSGKSSYAQTWAESQSENPVYLATARHWDDEFTGRIRRHQADRGEKWETIEELKNISRFPLDGRTVMLDCITLWLTNIFYDLEYDLDLALTEAKAEWDQFIKNDFNLIVVTNEIGMGVIAHEEISRKFCDLQGWMNQYIAKRADRVVLMVSGIPFIAK